MTIPMEYQHASEDFMRILADARDEAGLGTMNQSFTMVDGVLRTFRRRLSAADVVRFAGVLPPVLRAMFVTGWDPAQTPVPFDSREAMTREAQGLRQHHNFAPEDAIAHVATAVRRHVDGPAFDQVLAGLPPAAMAFWHGKA